MTPKKPAPPEPRIFGAPVWLWKSLGTAFLGLMLKTGWDITSYVLALGAHNDMQDQKFLELDKRLDNRKESMNKDVQNLKDRVMQLQGQVDQLHQDIRAYHGHK